MDTVQPNYITQTYGDDGMLTKMISFLEFNLINGGLMINDGIIYHTTRAIPWNSFSDENIQLEFENDFITDGRRTWRKS